MTAGTPRPLPFLGVPELEATPHVAVDGAAQPSTVLSLTHWPGSTTPTELARDLSAEIALAYLSSPAHWRNDAVAVTSDHLDQDGLVSIHALAAPEHALAHGALLVEVARAGDFAVATSDDALAIALALSELAGPGGEQAGTVPGGATGLGGPEGVAVRIGELLELLPGLVEDPSRARAICAGELASVEAGRRAVASGEVTLEVDDRAGLATVVVSDRLPASPASRFCSRTVAPLHPVVVHGLTDAVRVLVAHGRRYRYYDRYETWVRLASRRVPLRRAMAPLAERLSDRERGGARWRADGPGALEPSLELVGGEESSLSLPEVREAVAAYLLDAPVAWDPYAAAEEVACDGLRRPAAPRAGTTGRGRPRRTGRRRGRPSA